MASAIAITVGALATLLAVYLGHFLQFRREAKRNELELLRALCPVLEALRAELVTNSQRCLELYGYLYDVMRAHLDELESDAAHHDWVDFLTATGPYQDPNWPGWRLETQAFQRYLAREKWLVSEGEVLLSTTLHEYYGRIRQLQFKAEREREFATSERDFKVGQSVESLVWDIRACLEQVGYTGPLLDGVLKQAELWAAALSGSSIGRRRRVEEIRGAIEREDVRGVESWPRHLNEAEKIRGKQRPAAEGPLCAVHQER